MKSEKYYVFNKDTEGFIGVFSTIEKANDCIEQLKETSKEKYIIETDNEEA